MTTYSSSLCRPVRKRGEQRPSVLVVEDEAIVAHDFQRRLTRLGYTVTGLALDGQQAIAKAIETKPELILMDINLGEGMNGIEVAQTIQQQQDLPVIYITANSDADTLRCAAGSDPFGYILKPFEDRELETAIQMGMAKHEAECCLKESERRFNATLTSIADGVIAARPDGCIEFFNRAAEKISGWPQADTLGRKLSEVLPLQDDGTHGPDTDFFSSFGLPGVLPGDSRTAWLTRRDGARVLIEYRASHIRDERQPSSGVVISFSDITERHRAEQEIRRAQAELNLALGCLKQKHEELQSFYHIVSHEVKTPLTSAREFVSLVLEGLAGPVNGTQKEYLGIARESCDQMRTCINDMLDVTRLETGKMSVALKRCSAGDVARRVVTRLAPAAQRKGIGLTCTVKPGVGEILMDETRISQVISNLLNNALKFTPGGGRISVVVQRAETEAGDVQIVVADTGRGIPQEHLPRIFDRLYQVPANDTNSGMGLGLGLHICHELVGLHHGSIRVESEVGVGSTFCVTLPVSPQQSQAVPAISQAPASAAFQENPRFHANPAH
jgi:PAS domain S-box-containing protein